MIMELKKGIRWLPVISPNPDIKAIEFKGHFLFISFLDDRTAKYKVEYVECK
jgi:hypothetical protein